MRDPTKTEGGEGDKKVRNEVLCKLIDRVKLEEKKRFASGSNEKLLFEAP